MHRGGCALLACLLSVKAAAQSDYRNTDSGRPVRIEDALPVERHSLEWQFAPFKLERLQANVDRWQFEPRVTYGILPRTELELRAPFVYRERTAMPRGGLAGLGVGFLRNFNNETPPWPALALSGEVLLPVGGATTKPATWVARVAATRTVAFGRVHFNVAYGTYNQVVYPDVAGSPGCTQNCGFETFPPIADGPCSLEPRGVDPVPAPQPSFQQFVAPPDLIAKLTSVKQGRRLLAGIAADHSLPLWSTLVVGDLFVERFSMSTQSADWSAEVGLRHQVSPRVTIDAGLGRRFTGSSRAWFATVGSSYTMATAGVGQRGNCP
jgi:hypothetical protein